jgi:predicted Zn-dependent peptidase
MNINNLQLPSLKPEISLLDNETPFHFFVNGEMNVIRLEFLFSNAGRINQQKPFIAAITNAMLTEGTEKFSAYQIAEALDYYGAFVERVANMESFSIVFYFLEKYSENILPYIKQIILHPLFPQKQLDICIEKLKQQQQINEQKTSFIASKEFYHRIFNDNPYGQTGSSQDFDFITQKDISNFYDQYIAVQNSLTIIASGNITDRFCEGIKMLFGKSQRRKNISENDFLHINVNTQQKGEKYLTSMQNAQQVSIRLGKKIIKYSHNDFLPLKVLNTVLGGYFGSRLMTNIREEKGLSYGISSSVFSYKNAGVFLISADVKAEEYNLAIEEVKNELQKLIDEPIKEQELKRVRNYLTGDIIRSLDGSLDLGERYAYLISKDMPLDYFYKYMTVTRSITATELQQIAKKYLNPNTFIQIAVGKVK